MFVSSDLIGVYLLVHIYCTTVILVSDSLRTNKLSRDPNYRLQNFHSIYLIVFVADSFAPLKMSSDVVIRRAEKEDCSTIR